jgi:hypothetical protein
MTVRIFGFRNLLLSNAAVSIVAMQVVKAMARATKGMVRFVGSASSKYRFKAVTAS